LLNKISQKEKYLYNKLINSNSIKLTSYKTTIPKILNYKPIKLIEEITIHFLIKIIQA